MRLVILALVLMMTSVGAFRISRQVGRSRIQGNSSSRTVACSDAELAEYALLAAFGRGQTSTMPLHVIDCQPSQEQGLQPILTSTMPQKELATKSVRTQTSDETHFAHLLVVQSNARWCAHPCQSATWELQSPKPAADSPYKLFEAAIWPQTRRVTLYRFDPAWERRARRTYHDVCHGAWECPAYATFREKQALLSVGPWPRQADHDADKLSKFMEGAFRQIFAKIHSVVPQAFHFGLTYTGHGSNADGSLFEGALTKEHAVSVMKYVTGVGAAGNEDMLGLGPLSILNFGSNCEEGKWNMLKALHPFAKWIAASDLKVGGLDIGQASDEDQRLFLQGQQTYSNLVTLKDAAEGRLLPQAMLGRMVELRDQMWHEFMRNPIVDQKLRQTIAVYESEKFEAFRQQLRNSYLSVTPDYRGYFQIEVEKAKCDVMAAARLLDSTSAYEALRPFFASTMDMFEWDVKANGLGFNFLGWDESAEGFWRRGPPCDLVSAFGSDVPEPPGGWNEGDDDW